MGGNPKREPKRGWRYNVKGGKWHIPFQLKMCLKVKTKISRFYYKVK